MGDNSLIGHPYLLPGTRFSILCVAAFLNHSFSVCAFLQELKEQVPGVRFQVSGFRSNLQEFRMDCTRRFLVNVLIVDLHRTPDTCT